MNRYYKVNKKVAEHLGLMSIRNTTRDGNFLLWMNDLNKFGQVWEHPRILTEIGGVSLTGREAKLEIDGKLSTPLPAATDPRFVIETVKATATTTATENVETEETTETTENTENTESTESTETTDAAAESTEEVVETEDAAETPAEEETTVNGEEV